MIAVAAVPGGNSVLLRPTLPLVDAKLGESIAVDGVCLTVEAAGHHEFRVTVGPETLAVTTLGALRVGSRVHLERALRLADRLGGHLVLGHVDGVGVVERVNLRTDGLTAWVRVPTLLSRFVAAKGCITVDGVSLTVNEVDGDAFRIDLIPHTLAVTRLTEWRTGDRCNVEIDVVARYVERLVAGRS